MSAERPPRIILPGSGTAPVFSFKLSISPHCGVEYVTNSGVDFSVDRTFVIFSRQLISDLFDIRIHASTSTSVIRIHLIVSFYRLKDLGKTPAVCLFHHLLPFVIDVLCISNWRKICSGRHVHKYDIYPCESHRDLSSVYNLSRNVNHDLSRTPLQTLLLLNMIDRGRSAS